MHSKNVYEMQIPYYKQILCQVVSVQLSAELNSGLLLRPSRAPNSTKQCEHVHASLTQIWLRSFDDILWEL